MSQVTQVCLLPVQVYIAAGQSYELETKLRRLEQSAKNHFGGTTDSELSELEDVVALTAARVQSAESEVGGDAHLCDIIIHAEIWLVSDMMSSSMKEVKEELCLVTRFLSDGL